MDRSQQAHAIHFRHIDVCDDNIGAHPFRQLKTGFTITGTMDLTVGKFDFQERAQDFPGIFIILYKQD